MKKLKKFRKNTSEPAERTGGTRSMTLRSAFRRFRNPIFFGVRAFRSFRTFFKNRVPAFRPFPFRNAERVPFRPGSGSENIPGSNGIQVVEFTQKQEPKMQFSEITWKKSNHCIFMVFSTFAGQIYLNGKNVINSLKNNVLLFEKIHAG